MTIDLASSTPTADEIEGAIVGAQDDDGAFRSLVHMRGGVTEDRNVFITALVVRALGHSPLPRRLHEARERALDYLERGESPFSGAFAFWPPPSRPAWAPALPADADDTAIVALELHRAGRRSRDWLRRTALTRLLPFQVVDPTEEPEWVQRGAFRTWLAHGRANPVDIVVNTNVAALLAAGGLTDLEAYRSVVATIDAGVAWAGGNGARLRALAPFYANATEWRDALEHAVVSGATALRSAAREVARQLAPDSYFDPERPICCSAYGAIVWTAPALQLARAWATLRG